jgi:hypothetical protein
MTATNFQEHRYDPLEIMDANPGMSAEEAHKEAKKLRNTEEKKYRRSGYTASGYCLKNQLQKYKGWQQPDGRTRTVYYLRIQGGTIE